MEQQQQRYTLGKSDKLKSTKAIEQLFKEGKSFSAFPFRVLYLEALHPESRGPASSPLQTTAKYTEAGPQDSSRRASGYLQTAFSVSKKHFKKAVDRNRIKRLMREAWRLQKNVLASKINGNNKNLKVFIIYTGNELPEYDLVVEKTATVIKRLIKICNETTVTNT